MSEVAADHSGEKINRLASTKSVASQGDIFDREDFSAVDFINKLFPTGEDVYLNQVCTLIMQKFLSAPAHSINRVTYIKKYDLFYSLFLVVGCCEAPSDNVCTSVDGQRILWLR